MSRKKTNPENSTESQPTPPPAAKGQTPACAKPFQQRMAEMRQAMLEAITPQDLQVIIRQVLVKAQQGDLTAVKLLRYCVADEEST